jgi:hypothetical protein
MSDLGDVITNVNATNGRGFVKKTAARPGISHTCKVQCEMCSSHYKRLPVTLHLFHSRSFIL